MNSIPKAPYTLIDKNSLIKAIENNEFQRVESLLDDENININYYSEEGNPFLKLLYKIHYKNDKAINSLKLLINHPEFKWDIENIRNSLRLINSKKLHKIILYHIKKEKIIENLPMKDRTNLLLLLSHYPNKKTNPTAYSQYIKLFSKEQLKEAQEYFIHHFESYFNNSIYTTPAPEETKNTVQNIIKEVFFNKNYFKNECQKTIPMPKSDKIGLGEEIKYFNILFVIYHFLYRQNKIKKNKYCCLFENPKKFFIFFASYIRVHERYIDNDIENFFKVIKEKYGFSSITWDERYFYESFIEVKKDKIESAMNNTLKLFQLEKFKNVHLKFSSPQEYVYSATYCNLYNSQIPKNLYLIDTIDKEFKDFEINLVHEMTHYIHKHPLNKNCFKSHKWKKIKENIYLYKEKKEMHTQMQVLFDEDKEEKIINDIEYVLQYSYLKESLFKDKVIRILKKYHVNEEKKIEIINIIEKYKKLDYKKSDQFLLWDELSIQYNKNYKIVSGYLNKNHEIHARLNEILSSQKKIWNNQDYLTNKSVPFEILEKDLIAFNHFLVKKIND